ncbi:hypothetical protein LTR81_026132 [Elasticomyces elasticus]
MILRGGHTTILLDNKKASDLGPIICVCYTNHTLDQGLERLVDEDVQNVVRIGGSLKTERLADVNLRTVVQRLDFTNTETSDRYELTKKVEIEAKEINSILSQIGQLESETSLSGALESWSIHDIERIHIYHCPNYVLLHLVEDWRGLRLLVLVFLRKSAAWQMLLLHSMTPNTVTRHTHGLEAVDEAQVSNWSPSHTFEVGSSVMGHLA